MEYKLVVTRFEKNSKYSPKQDPYYRGPEEPEYLSYGDVLIVCLSESEFNVIKKAVIEVIK